MYELKSLFETAPGSKGYARGFLDLMGRMMGRIDADAVANLAELIEAAGADGRTIFTLGNGGSAVVASHFVNDLGVNSIVEGKRGFRVCSLSDNIASITAVANDVGFEDVFRRQLACDMVRGDVVIGLSVSGNSENVVRSIEYANDAGGVSVGICGFDGGRLGKVAQHVVLIPSTKDEYGPVEDAFSVVFHAVSGYLTMRRGRFLHH